MLNIGPGLNTDILARSQQLTGYVTFVTKIDEYKFQGFEPAEAIEKELHYCIDNQILIKLYTTSRCKTEVAQQLIKPSQPHMRNTILTEN